MGKSIYYRSPYCRILTNEIKFPLKAPLAMLFDSHASLVQKVWAVREALKILRKVESLPEPTLENVAQHNSRILVGIRDYFFARIKNIPLLRELRAVVNLVIMVYDTDFYRQFINVWVDELRKSDWKPNGPLQPDHHYWNQTGGE